MPALIRLLGATLLLLSIPAAQAADPNSRLGRADLLIITANKTHKEFNGGRVFRTVYYTADGHFTMIATGKNPVSNTGNWTIQGDVSNTDYLCTEAKLGDPCSTFTAVSGGKFIKRGGFTVEVLDGDAEHVVERVAQIKTGAATLAAARAAPPPGDYLTGEQIRTLITGKTTIERNPVDRPGQERPGFIYFQPDGVAYFLQGEGGLRTVWQGKRKIDGDRLCMEGGSWACAGFRRAAAGQLMKEYGNGTAGSRKLELADGDPHNVGTIVSNSYPYNQRTTSPGRPAQPPRPSFLDNTTVR